ncbi:hypothetical protein LINPERHAP1_LOCUS12041 [Linum perenne]
MGFFRFNRALMAVAILLVLMCQVSSARILCGSSVSRYSDAGTTTSSTSSDRIGVATMEKKYKSLLLNVLPKGSRAPSGPSKKTNNLVD